jgi:hypothetical protein
MKSIFEYSFGSANADISIFLDVMLENKDLMENLI